MAPLVGGDLGEHRSQAHFEEPGDGRGHFNASQVEAVGAFQLQDQLALHVIKGRQHGGHWLAVQGDEMVRRGQRAADRRFRLVDDEPVYGAILEGALAVEATLFAPVDSLPDRADFPLAHHNKVRQAFLNGPFCGRRTPVETSLVELRGELAGLLLNLLKLLAIEFEFGDGHSRDYSEATALPLRCATNGDAPNATKQLLRLSS
jgi:hypothetical protein